MWNSKTRLLLLARNKNRLEFFGKQYMCLDVFKLIYFQVKEDSEQEISEWVARDMYDREEMPDWITLEKYFYRLTPQSIRYAPPQIQRDDGFMREMVKSWEGALEYASEEVRNDKELLRSTHWIYVLQFAGDKLKRDRDFVLEAVDHDCQEFYYAIDKFRDDEEIARAAVEEDAEMAWFASERLRSDHSFAKFACKRGGYVLAYLSDELKDDEEVVKIACEYSVSSVRFASDRLRRDRDFILSLLPDEGMRLCYIHEDLCEDELVVRLIDPSAEELKRIKLDQK